ncbi:MAG: S26 family signal peptidase, partial [Alteromonadales bacterium]|nr:S26 family signal peptidase [Alteromonadales bacterium]
SMVPTLIPGDIVLVDSWVYQHQPPQKSQVALFHKNENTPETYIKRVAQTAGFEYQWQDKKQKNNQLLLADKQYFMMGDNHQFSHDSRHFGTITEDLLTAQAKFIIVSVAPGWQLRKLRSWQIIE